MEKFYKLLSKSLKENGCKTFKELWLKINGEGYEGFAMDVVTDFKQKRDDDNKFDAIFSTEDEDRHGDIVVQNWELKYFRKNPVYLDSHNYNSIEHIIGKVKDIKVDEKNRLVGKIIFALDNPKGELAFNLAKDKFINTSSVGFIPKEFDDKGKILKSELLEISAVSVPANPKALYEKYGITDDIKNKSGKGLGDNKDENNGKGKGKKDNEKDGGNGGSEEDKEIKKTFEKITKEFENWDETNEEIRLKVKDISEFEGGSLRKKTIISKMPKVFSNIGKLSGGEKKAVQMLFFPKKDGWTLDDAKKWFTVEEFKVLLNKGLDDKEKEFKKKEFENWDETNEEIRFKLRDILEFEQGGLKRKQIYDKMPRISCTLGKFVGEDRKGIQMLFFPKSDGWTMDDAKKWLTILEYQVLLSKNFESNEEKSLNQKIINIANRESKSRANALEKILKAVKLVEKCTPSAKDAEEDKKQQTKKLVNKTIRNLLKFKD